MNNDTERKEKMHELFRQAYDGSYYTIIGAGGDLEEWKAGYQEMLDIKDIGTISEWFVFHGKDMNAEYDLKDDDAYQDDLTFLAFPLNGLNVRKLALFKLRMEDRWFDDIVDNLSTAKPPLITQKIKDQILLIRDTGAVNMLDVRGVLNIAETFELKALARFLSNRSNHKAYGDFIFTGNDGSGEKAEDEE